MDDLNKLFVHKRYLGCVGYDLPIYFNCNGVLKSGVWRLFKQSEFRDNDYWYCVSDLPEWIQERVLDVAISMEEVYSINKAKNNIDTVLDSNQISVVINEETPVLPIVGNLLPSDGTSAYTAVYKGDSVTLKPILVCWGCHWSELFSGRTKYGYNVFCLASDLTIEQVENFMDDIIFLGDVPNYLNEMGEEEKILKL